MSGRKRSKIGSNMVAVSLALKDSPTDDRHRFISTSQKELRQRTVAGWNVESWMFAFGMWCFILFVYSLHYGEDGPSAGVTMATALVSLALDIPVRSNPFVLSRTGVVDEVGRPDVAMTGELTLMGKVLKARRFHQILVEEKCHNPAMQVGGIQEKAGISIDDMDAISRLNGETNGFRAPLCID